MPLEGQQRGFLGSPRRLSDFPHNGRACELLYAAQPEVFSYNPIGNWFAYFTLSGEPDHSIHKLDIGTDRLAGFADAVESFWLSMAELHSGGTG